MKPTKEELADQYEHAQTRDEVEAILEEMKKLEE